MAKMIPTKAMDYDPRSREDVMFASLEKNLPNDYYVFHSFKIIKGSDGTLNECEADFVIFNKTKGLLVIEAKAGHVRCVDGVWRYQNGDPIHNGMSPYKQASQAKWAIAKFIDEGEYSNLSKKCKMLHAVWFPSVSRHELQFEAMPSDAEAAVTLTREDLKNPLPKIEEIFELEMQNRTKTNMSDKQAIEMIKNILCPTFDIIPSAKMGTELSEQTFYRMLQEQKNILKYLTYQRSAVIQGAAGTGKTLIALQKAHNHADNGEKVLFLCYNNMLCEFLKKNNKHSFIDFYTIDGYACKLGDCKPANYSKVKSILDTYYLDGDFPYAHVIIDEGQDFGQDNIEENDIISLLYDVVMTKEDEESTFYVFYDTLQHVQGKKIPDCILNADCRLTLYKNCRNTENIAITSMRPIRDKKPRLIEGCETGRVPRIYFAKSEEEQVEKVADAISNICDHDIEDIVILTCKTEKTTVLKNEIVNGKYHGKYTFTTCRKFKGLEADAVVIVDLDEDALLAEAKKVFYVGASRAKFQLCIVTGLDKAGCANVLRGYGLEQEGRNTQKQLAIELNTMMG